MRKSLLSRIAALVLIAALPLAAAAEEPEGKVTGAKAGVAAGESQAKDDAGSEGEARDGDSAEAGSAEAEAKEQGSGDPPKEEKSVPFNLDASEYIMSLSEADRSHLIKDWSRYSYSDTKDGISYIHCEPAVPQPPGTFLIFPEWGGTDRVTGFARMASDEKWDSYVFLPTPELSSMRPSGNYSEEYLSKSAKAYTDYVRDACATAESSGGKIIIAVSGRSAPWLLSMLKTGLLESPAALVLINAQYPEEKTVSDMAQTVAALKYPVLDLVIGPEIGWLKASAEARRHEAGKKGSECFSQAKTGTPETAERKLRGWLKKNIGR